MATAPQERLDPVVSLAPPPPPTGETAPPPPSLAGGSDAAVADMDGLEVVATSARATAPSGFPLAGLIAAAAAHVLVAAAFYASLLYKPPEEFRSLGDAFEVTLAEDRAGHVDGKAQQAPDGAPRPDDRQTPNPHAAVVPAEPVPPAPAPAPAPPQPTPQTQQQSFDAMPTPVAPPPVPDTADAWAPRVHPALAPPAPPPPPAPAKPVTKTPPAVASAAPPVSQRPSMQRSVDLREIPGRAPHRELAAGSDSGGPDAVGYGMLVFRALNRVKYYPPGASERGDEGIVLLRVTIGESGRLIDAWIERGSGYPELDAATIQMAHRASYPPLPRTLGAQRTFDVPVHFGIRYR